MIAACGALLLGATVASAGNHLACYKAKDTGIPKQKISGVDLLSNTGSTVAKNGCIIATGAKLCCDSVDKIGVPPQPGGGGPVGATSKFCCYKAKCPKGPTDQNFPAQDQFGNRNVLLAKSIVKYICAPASPSGAFVDDAAF